MAFDSSIISALQGPTGSTGDTGTTGAQGTSAGIEFTFDTAVADANQDSGDIWLNNADASAATTLYIDDLDRHTNDITSWRGELDAAVNATGNYGYITLKKSQTNQTFLSIA